MILCLKMIPGSSQRTKCIITDIVGIGYKQGKCLNSRTMFLILCNKISIISLFVMKDK